MITTRLTKSLNIDHPVISAPMAFAAGGKLAASISKAGGLGLIGGAYGDAEWLEEQFGEAGNQKIGCGLITWSLENHPEVLDQVLDYAPKAIFLSFGNPINFTKKIKHSSAIFICQIQSLKDAKHAVDCGADIIVAQGAEAGGHGESRSTMTLVPEVADWMSNNASKTLLCAAGGIGDGRGLAASLMLGADGVLVGSRFWASEEALVHPNMLTDAINATGDDAIRSSVMDIARELDWPERYTASVLKNAFTDKWGNDLPGLISAGKEEADQWRTAWQEGNTDIANTFVGEVTGLIKDIKPAAKILHEMVDEAERLISENLKKCS